MGSLTEARDAAGARVARLDFSDIVEPAIIDHLKTAERAHGTGFTRL